MGKQFPMRAGSESKKQRVCVLVKSPVWNSLFIGIQYMVTSQYTTEKRKITELLPLKSDFIVTVVCMEDHKHWP